MIFAKMSLRRILDFFDYIEFFCVPYSGAVITTTPKVGKDGKSPQRKNQTWLHNEVSFNLSGAELPLLIHFMLQKLSGVFTVMLAFGISGGVTEIRKDKGK